VENTTLLWNTRQNCKSYKSNIYELSYNYRGQLTDKFEIQTGVLQGDAIPFYNSA